jgi:hypothetical protein
MSRYGRPPFGRRAGQNPVVTVLGEPRLEARVERAVRAAVGARRAELERLVRARVDEELARLAGDLVAAQLADTANGAAPAPRLCSRCGLEPALHHRTVGRECLRARARELAAGRRAERQSATDDEEPHPASIAADELARRARRHSGVDARELEKWLRAGGLAEPAPDGLLRPTPLAVELAQLLEDAYVAA